ncbi:hypothetical protein [Natrinema salinisoli]|uniref:hypothetical protein n=1 Tax=Natrinema salinisoli TaxID=2878535 RepID=UPI001CEFFC63|nr:hypothetical protein [Natrinema salinisoli]
MIVEDNPRDRRLLEETFYDDQSHNAIHTVTDGQAALNFIYRRRLRGFENRISATKKIYLITSYYIETFKKYVPVNEIAVR